MPPLKRRKLSDDEESHEDAENAVSDDEELASLSEASAAESGGNPDGEDSDLDMDDLKRQKSKKTMKRKIRATGASTFGATLQNLLQTEAPSSLPLSLKPSIARKHQDTKLELKAKKVLQLEKKEQEDKRRIKDVIGGWGGESERALRKVAQRGVVKLFNAIQQSQNTVAEAAEEAKAAKGSGKPRLLAPTFEDKGKKKGKKRDNVVGRGKETTVDKDEFFNMIKSGGIVSKA
ncbi:Rrp15p-domain-containing protein [Coprinopsis sp. MPI-PUGE-AT-0042]|nr:Rrp15p-domain-containing protein [Coprinopsis sp. MPI-PUGE-AT-0042]